MHDFRPKNYIWDEPFISEDYKEDQIIRIRNISCSDCHSNEFCKKVECAPMDFKKKYVSPIRRCTMQTIKDALSECSLFSKKVLEIGCGDWDFTKTIIEEQQGKWTGVDLYRSAITSTIYNGINLPFQDETFDGILANQVLEHVHDGAKMSPGQVISQWVRVLKRNGFLFANMPIHLHGSQNFRFGNIDSIIRMFPPRHFSFLKLVFYRRDFLGMAPARVLIDYSSDGWISGQYSYHSDLDTWKRKSFKQKAKIRLALLESYLLDSIISLFPSSIPFAALTSNPYLKSAYVLDIRATKK